MFSLYESSTSPMPIEMRTDMLGQIMAAMQQMDAGELREFHDFVQWYGVQKYGLSGTTEEILQKMHPWQLQMVQQRFRISAQTPDGTPVVGLNRS
jgi:hypothetical protein